MKVIRNSIFETASSSVHAICIDLNEYNIPIKRKDWNPDPDTVSYYKKYRNNWWCKNDDCYEFKLGEFYTKFEAVDQWDYYWTYINLYCKDEVTKSIKLNIRKLFKEYGINKVKFEKKSKK